MSGVFGGGKGPNGPEIRAFKEQLRRLSSSLIRISTFRDDHTGITRIDEIDEKIVRGRSLNLWFPKDEQQRVLWPSTIQLSLDYFISLQEHAVPLNERALAALSHSAMALDIYAWLAQRLHRIPHRKPQFISWAALKEQFGADFGRMNNFRSKFRAVMLQVLGCYSKAKVEADYKGLTLRYSPPPVSARMIVVEKPGNQ